MLKPSEIIRMAMNHPSYLADSEHGGDNWLCGVITCKLRIESKPTDLAIENSLDGHSFLRLYLQACGTIDRGTPYQSPEYRKAAFVHWNALIEKLEKEGK